MVLMASCSMLCVVVDIVLCAVVDIEFQYILTATTEEPESDDQALFRCGSLTNTGEQVEVLIVSTIVDLLTDPMRW